jgi:hypothetical protein
MSNTEIPASTRLVLELAAASAADLAFTTNRLQDVTEARLKSMAETYLDLYNAISDPTLALPRHLHNLIDDHAFAADRARGIIEDATP